MSGIEPVEKIAEFEAALSIVEITQNEGKRGIVLPCDRGGSCCALVDPVIVEQIQDRNQEYTFKVGNTRSVCPRTVRCS